MFTTRPELQGTFGMVSATHWLASAAGMAVLEAGGNAFDAACAAGFTLQVVEPHLNGPAGDLPVIFAGPGSETTVLCGQGPAPAGATIAHYRGLGFDLIPGSGPLAASVPGATSAWLTLLRDHGTKTLRDVLDAALGYAAGGIPVLPQIARSIGTVAPLFRSDWTTSAEVYLPGGAVPAAGSWLTNPALAGVWTRLITEAEAATSSREGQLEHALHAWSQGWIAEEIDAFAGTPWLDSSGERHAGVLTGADLAAWAPSYEAPATLEYDGWTVAKTGPWGQGPVLLQQLALLPQPGTPGTADFVHQVVEASKLAFADREAWYGDATDVPLQALLSAEYGAQRRALIGAHADLTLRPGLPGARLPQAVLTAGERADDTYDPTSSDPTVSRTGDEPRGDTCHVSVGDRWGNLVACTPSGGWLTSSPVIPALGFPLGTRLQMAWLEEGLPNSLRPGRRPRTTLSPSLALRDGRPALAFGTPGGDQQDQWQLGFLLNHLSGMNLQEAIDAPAFHSTHFPSSFYPREAHPGQLVVEERIGADVVAELRRRGHDVVVSSAWSLGRMCAVSQDGRGHLAAAANPRGMQGYAAGR
ncbi:gamma-glutamyltransferase [Jatrophihabitans sp.]|uniref:gamma-glutamyltransferase family protein n=1 Tax=Jatrophihabitans sp. TaxID=1932789 RepID=UPI0030C744AA|nr:gamma-glutamyltransferase [Jatrophihabitans sp.]